MPTKSYVDDVHCNVGFRLPAEAGASSGFVVGEFNDWQPDATPLDPQPDGSLTAEVTLEAGRSYRFRYFVDGDRWENDWAADAYVDNEHGGSDSVVTVPKAKREPADHGTTGAGPGPDTAVAASEGPPATSADGADGSEPPKGAKVAKKAAKPRKAAKKATKAGS